jgi:hypothetical protein
MRQYLLEYRDVNSEQNAMYEAINHAKLAMLFRREF